MYKKTLPSPRQSMSEPPQKRPENPSGATAVSVDRIHRGPRRDQPLDHGIGIAEPSRVMQRRLASGAGDATGTAGRLRAAVKKQRDSHGMFLRVVGQKF